MTDRPVAATLPLVGDYVVALWTDAPARIFRASRGRIEWECSTRVIAHTLTVRLPIDEVLPGVVRRLTDEHVVVDDGTTLWHLGRGELRSGVPLPAGAGVLLPRPVFGQQLGPLDKLTVRRQRSRSVAALLAPHFLPGPSGHYLASTDASCSLSSMVWRPHLARAMQRAGGGRWRPGPVSREGEPAVPLAATREAAARNDLARPLATIRAAD